MGSRLHSLIRFTLDSYLVDPSNAVHSRNFSQYKTRVCGVGLCNTQIYGGVERLNIPQITVYKNQNLKQSNTFILKLAPLPTISMFSRAEVASHFPPFMEGSGSSLLMVMGLRCSVPSFLHSKYWLWS